MTELLAITKETSPLQHRLRSDGIDFIWEYKCARILWYFDETYVFE